MSRSPAPLARSLRSFAQLVLACACLAFTTLEARADTKTPAQLENIGIEDRAGAQVPRDVKLEGSDGRTFVLGEYMDGEKPLVLVLAYYGCPMLCSLVLNGTTDALKSVDAVPGRDYRLLVVSFDPRDTSDVAKEKREAYVEALGLGAGAKALEGEPLMAFEFARGSESEVARLAEAIGFRYRWDEEEQQYAHAAGLFVVTPEGKLSQALTGIKFERDDLSSALVEAKKGVWHSPLKSVLLYCFQYDPLVGKYTLQVKQLLKVGAALTVALILLLLLRLFVAERRRARSAARALAAGTSDGAASPRALITSDGSAHS
jgi:protein SCO1/2